MPLGDVETFYAMKRWHNRIQGTSEVFGSTTKRATAIWAGRARARQDATAHVIRGRDGQLMQLHSYAEVQRVRKQYGDAHRAGLVRLLAVMDQH